MSNTNKDINNETNIENSEISLVAKPKKESIFKTTVKKITNPPKKEEKTNKQLKPKKDDQQEIKKDSKVDEVPVKENKTNNTFFKQLKERKPNGVIPKWLEADMENLSGKVIALPVREDIGMDIREQLIVELYSK